MDLTQPSTPPETPRTGADPELRPPRHRVSPRARWFWLLRAMPAWVVLLAIELAVGIGNGWLHGAAYALPVLTVVLAAAHLLVMPRWRYAVHRYEVTDEAVYTQSGWFTVERRIAPISRVQTVDTTRGPIEQVFRLSNVTVTTASSAGALEIKGLERADAEALVEHLTSTTQATRGDAT